MTRATPPIRFEHVWKQYRIGVKHDSLRDAIPSMLKRFTRRGDGEEQDDASVFWAMRDVSFEVNQAETVGLIGRNGAGKSTILKLLSKITTQTRGRVTLRGKLAALIELGGGFHPDLSGRENIFLQGTMLGLSHRQIKRHFDSIVAFSELEAFLETPVKRYSSGMVMRLGFAIAAHVEPDILLLDEVLAVGDLAFQQKCFKRIAELKSAGTTMMFISHNLEEVQRLCDRVVWLKDGRVAGEGLPHDTIRRYREDILAAARQPGERVVTRHGEVAIERVVLRDAQGLEIESIETGRPLRVDIEFNAGRPVRQPSFRVRIERLDGLLCHATSSRSASIAPSILEGEGAIGVDYQAVNLLPNFYHVVVELFEGRSPIPVAVNAQGGFFQTVSDRPEQGAMHLPHAWKSLETGPDAPVTAPRVAFNPVTGPQAV